MRPISAAAMGGRKHGFLSQLAYQLSTDRAGPKCGVKDKFDHDRTIHKAQFPPKSVCRRLIQKAEEDDILSAEGQRDSRQDRLAAVILHTSNPFSIPLPSS